MNRTLIVALFVAALASLALIAAQPPEGKDKKGPPGKKGKGPGGDDVKTDKSAKAAFGTATENAAPPTPAGLTPLAGRWYVKTGTPNVYFYRDADKFVDLFAGQIKDTNGDGVPDLRLSHDERFLILESQNLPNHPHATFPNSGNPNTIKPQQFRFKLPLVPKPADAITTVPMGPVGVAVNGVVFFNPFEQGGVNAVAGYAETWFDSCCGHPQQEGVYHYHKFPSCLKTPFPDDGDAHSPPIGFAWDGYPVYGPYESKGVMAKDVKGAMALDACNGHFDPDRGYHYHATPDKFPYMIGGYAGVVERSNSRPLNRVGTGSLIDTTSGESRTSAGIASVTPGTAARGATHTLRIVLNPAGARGRLPDGPPSRVVVGPFEATTLARDGDVVTCEIAVPADARRGALYDCHLEFTGGRTGTAALKKNNAFRVGGE